ncbi:MAG: hypothetical protein V1647_02725 [Pseudomonadota bacterium]
MNKIFLLILSATFSLNLFTQPTSKSLTLEQAKSALATPSTIQDITKKYEIILDDSWDWFNRIGAYDNEIYFNKFRYRYPSNKTYILNRYCGTLGGRNIAIKLQDDATDMEKFCGQGSVTVIELKAGENTFNVNGVSFNVMARVTIDDEAYYKLYSSDYNSYLVFVRTNLGFPTQGQIEASHYRSYLRESYAKDLCAEDVEADSLYLCNYGMDFNHRRYSEYGASYCASLRNASNSEEIAKVVFYIEGEETAAKCNGVPTADLVKIKLPDPGVDGKEHKIEQKVMGATFNLLIKGHEEDLTPP